MPKELLKKENNKGGGGRSRRKQVKSEEGKVCQEKNNVCQKKKIEDDGDKDQETVKDETMESGYSSGEKEDTNVIYYKVQFTNKNHNHNQSNMGCKSQTKNLN